MFRQLASASDSDQHTVNSCGVTTATTPSAVAIPVTAASTALTAKVAPLAASIAAAVPPLVANRYDPSTPLPPAPPLYEPCASRNPTADADVELCSATFSHGRDMSKGSLNDAGGLSGWQHGDHPAADSDVSSGVLASTTVSFNATAVDALAARRELSLTEQLPFSGVTCTRPMLVLLTATVRHCDAFQPLHRAMHSDANKQPVSSALPSTRQLTYVLRLLLPGTASGQEQLAGGVDTAGVGVGVAAVEPLPVGMPPTLAMDT